MEYKLLGVGIPSRYSEYLLMVNKFDVDLELAKWSWNWPHVCSAVLFLFVISSISKRSCLDHHVYLRVAYKLSDNKPNIKQSCLSFSKYYPVHKIIRDNIEEFSNGKDVLISNGAPKVKILMFYCWTFLSKVRRKSPNCVGTGVAICTLNTYRCIGWKAS